MYTRSNFHPVKTTPTIKGDKDDKLSKKLQPKKNCSIESTNDIIENKSFARGRGPRVEQSRYMLNMQGTKVYQNIALKSHYCMEELKKQEGEYLTMSGSKSNRSKNFSHSANPRIEPEVNRNESYCDVSFLRKLLAMNKKEEMILNRKLAQLVLEDEFGFKNEESNFTKNMFSKTSVPNCDPRKERKFTAFNENKQTKPKVNHPLNCVLAKKSNNNTNHAFHTQYDLNGRRIYYDSEIHEDSESEGKTSTTKYTSESEDENLNPSVKFTAGSSKTYINTTTVIKTKSDITCDSSGISKANSRRTSMTMMNQPVPEKKETRVRRMQVEGIEDDSKYKKCLFTKVDAPGKEYGHERRENSPGDGVQNVVVHCCKVAEDKISPEPKKKVLKVWNFNDIPKIKPVKLENPNVKCDVQQMKGPPATWNKEKEIKSTMNSKDDRITRQPSATRNVFVQRKSRPNTVC